MPVQLDKLDREAAAMLYLAGELEPAEREAFERRLAGEPQLAAEVEQVRAAQQSIAAELQRADAHSRLPASEGVVVRRVSRAIGSWLVGRTAATIPAVKKGWPMPWWSYPAAVAASLVVGFLVWSSSQEVPPMSASPEATEQLTVMEAEQAELAEWLTTSLDATADASTDMDMERLLSTGRLDDLNAVYLSPQPEENSQ
jgi:anti-sigma factor RsiW